MYFITGVVKHKYVENGLNVPENWKELYFYMTDRDLGIIGGQKNITFICNILFNGCADVYADNDVHTVCFMDTDVNE